MVCKRFTLPASLTVLYSSTLEENALTPECGQTRDDSQPAEKARAHTCTTRWKHRRPATPYALQAAATPTKLFILDSFVLQSIENSCPSLRRIRGGTHALHEQTYRARRLIELKDNLSPTLPLAGERLHYFKLHNW